MSFRQWKKYIEVGDLVIVYMTKENMAALVVTEEGELNNRFGVFKHKDMIGKEFGSKMISANYKGFVYLLHPTPELWTLVLPHRTQILYIADISFITTYLDMKPGACVIESGTGSGSFSHSIARTIAPTGKLFSFEYHSERASLARQEFNDHGLSHLITLEHRDVCKDGFGLKNAVNSVFLDLPAPWEAIASAKEAFQQHRTGKICTFSPCIEQITRTVTALNEHAFVDITMYECLIRDHGVIPIQKLDFSKALLPTQPSSATVPSTPLAPLASSADTATVLQKRKSPEDTTATTLTDAETDTTSVATGQLLVSKTPNETRGHTSYLLFATFLPAIEPQAATAATAATTTVDTTLE
ncbi:tRNA methyltransferase complex GCD14 subunit-domain-containing protein [Spinellus fusiger]|nr:tRNA methyltransferase complex GCD14 subunit-domain-containing protein [Spinellus fusiger]